MAMCDLHGTERDGKHCLLRGHGVFGGTRTTLAPGDAMLAETAIGPCGGEGIRSSKQLQRPPPGMRLQLDEDATIECHYPPDVTKHG